MKKYLPIVIFWFLTVFPVILVVFLASERAVAKLERLEQDIVIVQNTQFDLFQQIATKSAVKSATISGKVK